MRCLIRRCNKLRCAPSWTSAFVRLRRDEPVAIPPSGSDTAFARTTRSEISIRFVRPKVLSPLPRCQRSPRRFAPFVCRRNFAPAAGARLCRGDQPQQRVNVGRCKIFPTLLETTAKVVAAAFGAPEAGVPTCAEVSSGMAQRLRLGPAAAHSRAPWNFAPASWPSVF